MGGHLYVPLSRPIHLFYTMKHLRKLHKQFAHTPATKLYDLLKTSGAKAVTLKTPEKLEYLVSICEPCQKIKTAPKRYYATMGAKNTRFNAKVYIDFIYIEGASVL